MQMLKDVRLVWDLPLRLFHWLLVVSLIGMYLTAQPGSTWMNWHFRLGYCVIGMLIFRLIWGLVGPRHARFVNFIKGPRSILQYVKGGIVSVGHNPLGAGMVVLMLLLLIVQVCTGLVSTDDIAFTGPFNPSVSHDLGETLTGIHHKNFYVILGAVVLHLAPKPGQTEPGGMHGYDVSRMPEMRGIFYAAGPDLKAGLTIEEFQNIHIYPLIAHILGLHAPDGIDGKLSVLEPVLRAGAK